MLIVDGGVNEQEFGRLDVAAVGQVTQLYETLSRYLNAD